VLSAEGATPTPFSISGDCTQISELVRRHAGNPPRSASSFVSTASVGLPSIASTRAPSRSAKGALARST